MGLYQEHPGPVAQLVRARSLYLRGRWFKSIQAHLKSSMFYVTIFLFILGMYFAFSGYRNDDSAKKGLALALIIAGFGTLIIMFFALSALDFAL